MTRSQEVLDEFRKHGKQASYHYADDSGNEWRLGKQEEDAALALYDANPDLQEDMRDIATGFLWSLKMRRS